MDAAAYRIMADTEASHWWWEGRRRILRRVLMDLRAAGRLPAGPLYDLGCGVGSNLGVLAEFGPAIGYDASEECVACTRSRGWTSVEVADLSRGEEALPASARPGALVLLADVLEHLDAEAPALMLARRLLVAGGILVVTVPALPWLWGPADDLNHHRRRYTPRALGSVVAEHFAVDRVTFFNGFLFAPIALARAIERAFHLPGCAEIRPPWRPANALLRRIFAAEAGIVAHGGFPLGVSLLCVAHKRRTGET